LERGERLHNDHYLQSCVVALLQDKTKVVNTHGEGKNTTHYETRLTKLYSQQGKKQITTHDTATHFLFSNQSGTRQNNMHNSGQHKEIPYIYCDPIVSVNTTSEQEPE
jgi:hypothetical protein